MKTVAALYVEPDGVYAGQPGVDLWPESRDARLYAGPHPVVAHPPCARWSSLANLVEAVHGIPKRADGGCFAAALDSVRTYGGVLEHPAGSAAWQWFGMRTPPSDGGWVVADWWGGWTCCVAQRNYGHRARKQTWLYAVGVDLPSLVWGNGPEPEALVAGTTPGRAPGASYSDRAQVRASRIEYMGRAERLATPTLFRDLLLSMARTVDA